MLAQPFVSTLLVLESKSDARTFLPSLYIYKNKSSLLPIMPSSDISVSQSKSAERENRCWNAVVTHEAIDQRYGKDVVGGSERVEPVKKWCCQYRRLLAPKEVGSWSLCCTMVSFNCSNVLQGFSGMMCGVPVSQFSRNS